MPIVLLHASRSTRPMATYRIQRTVRQVREGTLAPGRDQTRDRLATAITAVSNPSEPFDDPHHRGL